MVKVNIISRSKLEWTKDRSGEVPRANRNYEAGPPPMAKQLEYARALRAAKMDRMFAKPFVAAMGGHQDTVQSIACDSTNLASLATGGADGQLIHWDVMARRVRRSFPAHRHAVDGLCFTPDGVAMLTASRDKTVKLWDTDFGDSAADVTADPTPLAEYLGESPFAGIDHNWRDNTFATAGHELQVWDINRTRPIQSFTWGDETLTCVAYNKVETHLCAAAMLDRGVCIYDTRAKTGHSKLIMTMTCTSLSWNPMDPNMFVAGCDDWNCYTFDMRITARPRGVFQGAVKGINSVDFCPTGRKFAAGSSDNTVRIWSVDQATKSASEEMYHTKRMARVLAVKWSLDNNYIFSGSEDAVVRVWKGDSSAPIRPFRGAERSQFNYMRSLRDRYKQHPEIKRIVNQRNTPVALKTRTRQLRAANNSEMVTEMAKRKTTETKPLAKKRTVQNVK
jgi:WD repeat and SOF domain-containing protein 1